MLLLPRVLTARPVPPVRAPRRAWTQLRCAVAALGGFAMSSFAAAAGAPAAAPSTRHVRGGTIEVVPGAARPYDSLVVISHGLGDSAEGFHDVAELFARQMPRTKFVLPTAPEQPVTLNGGMRMNSWYDITGLSDRASERCDGIEQSAATITAILDAEHANGVPYSRMVLAGFSQGGALSLFTGLQLPAEKRLAGVLCLSGYLAGASKFRLTPALAHTPVLHLHGHADPMVKWQWAEQTLAALKQQGATAAELRGFKGLQHSVSQEELGVALAFLQRVLPSREEPAASKLLGEMSVRELKAAIERAGLGQQAVGLLEKKDMVELLRKASGKDEL